MQFNNIEYREIKRPIDNHRKFIISLYIHHGLLPDVSFCTLTSQQRDETFSRGLRLFVRILIAVIVDGSSATFPSKDTEVRESSWLESRLISVVHLQWRAAIGAQSPCAILIFSIHNASAGYIYQADIYVKARTRRASSGALSSCSR